MDQLNAQEESSYRSLRKGINIGAAIFFVALFACVAFGFYNFHISSLNIGERITINIGSQAATPYTCESSPRLVIHYSGLPANTITAKLDGTQLRLEREGIWGTKSAQMPNLEDGEHVVNISAGTYSESWSFIVDTEAPTIDLRGPLPNAATAKDGVTFYGTTKPNSVIVVKNDSKSVRQSVNDTGSFKFVVPLTQGVNTLQWTICDRAGNQITGQNQVVCDQTAPSVEPVVCSLDDSEQATPKSAGFIFTQRNLVLKLKVIDLDTGIKKTSYSLDGKPEVVLPIPADSEAVDDEDSDTNTEGNSQADNSDDNRNGSVDGTNSDDSSGTISNYNQETEVLDSMPSEGDSHDEALNWPPATGFMQTQGQGNDSESDSSKGSDESSDNSEANKSNDEDSSDSTAQSAPIGTADDEKQATSSIDDRPSPSPTLTPLQATQVTAKAVKGEPLIPGAKGRKTEYAVPLNKLFDGDHTLSVTSVNGVGTSNKRVVKFKVDSTDKFGEAVLYLGAIGDDVTTLQRRLAGRGYLKGDYEEGTYDQTTKQAVAALQKELFIAPDGVCGPQVFGALDKRVYVNLSCYEAKLVTENDKVFTYPICIGVDKHPTPTGWFYIADKAVDPTWLPPNSEWAKDAKAIDPGPDNPLGTRWIGLNIGSVGFHGTPYPDSVGTKASHGCMRMRRADVEDLFDRVSIGTQVRIYAGDEKDKSLRQYWP